MVCRDAASVSSRRRFRPIPWCRWTPAARLRAGKPTSRKYPTEERSSAQGGYREGRPPLPGPGVCQRNAAFTSGLLRVINDQMPIGNPRRQQAEQGSIARMDAVIASPCDCKLFIFMAPTMTRT